MTNNRPTSATDAPNALHIEGSSGIHIPVRTYGLDAAGTPVVMMHGLQSHSGWFVQSGELIASVGCPAYTIDRRGSGLSRQKRGDCSDFREMVDDQETVARRALRDVNREKVHVLGHCYGAIPATTFAMSHPDLVASLILATPGIHTKTDLTPGEKIKVFWGKASGQDLRIGVPLEPTLFSELDEYVEFIRGDSLSLVDATASFYFEVLRARRFIAKNVGRLTMPVFMACAGQDPICDNDANQQMFETVPVVDKRIEIYGQAKHVLEFSRERDRFFGDLSNWLTEHETKR